LAEAVRGVRRPARAAALLDYVRARDTVVVVALDRLGRSLSGVIRTVETLTERGVLLRSLREGIDYSTPTGRMLAGIFAALAAASEGTPAGLTGTTFAPGTPGAPRPVSIPSPPSVAGDLGDPVGVFHGWGGNGTGRAGSSVEAIDAGVARIGHVVTKATQHPG
jgi:Resolvase, N terminal domain